MNNYNHKDNNNIEKKPSATKPSILGDLEEGKTDPTAPGCVQSLLSGHYLPL